MDAARAPLPANVPLIPAAVIVGPLGLDTGDGWTEARGPDFRFATQVIWVTPSQAYVLVVEAEAVWDFDAAVDVRFINMIATANGGANIYNVPGPAPITPGGNQSFFFGNYLSAPSSTVAAQRSPVPPLLCPPASVINVNCDNPQGADLVEFAQMTFIVFPLGGDPRFPAEAPSSPTPLFV